MTEGHNGMKRVKQMIAKVLKSRHFDRYLVLTALVILLVGYFAVVVLPWLRGI